jgi:class 3 adenylate cyclase
MPRSATADAERRQITVLFCDLVDSTALATQLDPEDLRAIITAFQRSVAQTITHYEGFVAKYMGDGVLVYFGYPRAQEHDAERALRAGLALVGAAGEIEAPTRRTLRLRVGIATGLIGDLIGAGSAREEAVVGETPNLAARLQSLAEPNTVLICPTTRRLVGDLFEYRDLGQIELKGFAVPVPVWRVLRDSSVASLTPLVGREEELQLLLRRWERGQGRCRSGYIDNRRARSGKIPRHCRLAGPSASRGAHPITRFLPNMERIRTASRRSTGSTCRSCKRASTARNMPSFVLPAIWERFMTAGASVTRRATFSPRPARASSGARKILIFSKRGHFSPS